MEFLQRTRSSDRATNEAAEVLMMNTVLFIVVSTSSPAEERAAQSAEYIALF